MQTEIVDIESLKLDPKNARKHNPKNLEVIKASLKQFGQQKNIVVDKDNVVIAGNGFLTAARELGWKTITISRFQLSYKDARAFALADNRSNELSEWDEDVLRETIRELNDINFDVGQIGFDLNDFGLKGIGDDDLNDKNKELNEDDFENLKHQCPRCGFEFDKSMETNAAPTNAEQQA